MNFALNLDFRDSGVSVAVPVRMGRRSQLDCPSGLQPVAKPPQLLLPQYQQRVEQVG